MSSVISKEEFESLPADARGYAVYWMGEREDQPNVPNEPNPYLPGSVNHDLWELGQRKAVIAAIDSGD